MRNLLISAVAILASACASDRSLKPDEVVILDGSVVVDQCASLPELNRAGCFESFLLAEKPKVVIYHARGITGANDVYVPDAVAVLEGMVRDCSLGRTYLVYHTDGVATLHIEKNGLSDTQVACIRSHERPGLFLENAHSEPSAERMDSSS